MGFLSFMSAEVYARVGLSRVIGVPMVSDASGNLGLLRGKVHVEGECRASCHLGLLLTGVTIPWYLGLMLTSVI